MNFINESKPKEPDNHLGNNVPAYRYDKPSKYLFQWSRLFQIVISQAGSFLLSGRFHESECAIYKCEGGVRIEGFGDLVLGNDMCYFDHSHDKNKSNEIKLANLITHVVIHWNPMRPIDSMIYDAAFFVKCDVIKLHIAVEKSRAGGVFGGDSLSDFFSWNPFSSTPIDRDYKRYCLITFNGKTPVEVDKEFAIIDLGKSLLKKINDKINTCNKNSYYSALCCSPRQFENDGLHFWINTGGQTQIDGWKTQKQIEEFLSSDGIILDTARY